MNGLPRSHIVLAFWPLIFCFCLGGMNEQDLPKSCETFFGSIALESLLKVGAWLTRVVEVNLC